MAKPDLGARTTVSVIRHGVAFGFRGALILPRCVEARHMGIDVPFALEARLNAVPRVSQLTPQNAIRGVAGGRTVPSMPNCTDDADPAPRA